MTLNPTQVVLVDGERVAWEPGKNRMVKISVPPAPAVGKRGRTKSVVKTAALEERINEVLCTWGEPSETKVSAGLSITTLLIE
jgi:hypothetical protein